jgi:heme exporter protein C
MTAQAQKLSVTDIVFVAMVVATAACCVYSLHVIFFVAPIEASMGIVQKIFYFHVPSAYGMYLGATVCFIGSIGYLWRGTLGWDAMARAGADVAVVMGLMVMISGPLWAAKAWGTVWTWDPRLTTSLLSLLIYVAYGILRAFTAGGEAERRFAAALGILGAANLPIIKYSVQKWGGQHPKVISKGGGGLQHPDMKWALALGFLTFTLMTIVLVWHRARVYRAEMRLEGMEQEAIELGLAGD